MTTGLMVLIGLLSAGILAGRVYEILKLTDETTGFFLYKGIVFNPYILIIFIIITVCCAVLIFGNCKNSRPFFSHTSKLIAVAAAVMFLIYGMMAVTNVTFAPFVIAGAVVFAIIGTVGLKADAGIADIAAVALSVVFTVGLCLDVIIFNVNSDYAFFFPIRPSIIRPIITETMDHIFPIAIPHSTGEVSLIRFRPKRVTP